MIRSDSEAVEATNRWTWAVPGVVVGASLGYIGVLENTYWRGQHVETHWHGQHVVVSS